MPTFLVRSFAGTATCFFASVLAFGEPARRYMEPLPADWPSVHGLLTPPKPVPIPGDAADRSSLEGKILAGYQGWFVADDGSGLEWTHYGPRRSGDLRIFRPGSTTIDLWPDMREAGPSERYPSEFKHADGRVAEVFTSRHPDTIDRHFRWMREYGLDGVFLQRFGSALKNPALAAMRNQVLTRLRSSAARHGRTWTVMYDLSGLAQGMAEFTIKDDWRRLVDVARIREDPRLQYHAGRPLVALWGVGFNDGRAYTLDECERLVRWLKEDPVYGGNSVMIGVPYAWRSGQRDALADPALLRICAAADVISPWTVGRLRDAAQVVRHGEEILEPDIAWARQNGVAYMPVIFPGFSWHNLKRTRGESAPFNAIPRRAGQFLEAQGTAVIAAGAKMIYVAMYDELDEGTAIMKIDPSPPIGSSPFLAEPGVEPDHYLRLVGRLGERLRQRSPSASDGELPVTDTRRPYP